MIGILHSLKVIRVLNNAIGAIAGVFNQIFEFFFVVRHDPAARSDWKLNVTILFGFVVEAVGVILLFDDSIPNFPATALKLVCLFLVMIITGFSIYRLQSVYDKFVTLMTLVIVGVFVLLGLNFLLLQIYFPQILYLNVTGSNLIWIMLYLLIHGFFAYGLVNRRVQLEEDPSTLIQQ